MTTEDIDIPPIDYRECGLPVTVRGVSQRLKSKGFKTIPMFRQLHRAITERLLKSSDTLNKEEIRFLRTEAGLREEEVPSELMRVKEDGSFVGNVVDARFRLFIMEKLGIPIERLAVIRSVKHGSQFGLLRPDHFMLAYDSRDQSYVALN